MTGQLLLLDQSAPPRRPARQVTAVQATQLAGHALRVLRRLEPSPQTRDTVLSWADALMAEGRDNGGLWWALIPTTEVTSVELLDTLNEVRHALATHLRARAPGDALIWSPSRENKLLVEVDGEAVTLPLKPPGRHGGCAHSLGAQTLLLLLHQRLPAGNLRLADARGNVLTPGAFLQAAGWRQDSCLRALTEALGLTLGSAVFADLGSPRWFI